MDFKAVARQLRKPEGEFGVQVGKKMNEGNELINRWTIAELCAAANENILEIGMGNGFFVSEIVSLADSIQYTGCDFSPTMIEEATKINHELIEKGRVTFTLTSADKLPFADNSFHKVFTINTIYFWVDPARELAEIKRTLMPGGKLIISIRPRHTMITLPFTQYGFNFFEKDDLKELLLKNSFKVLKMVEKREPDQLMNGEMIRMDALILIAEK